MPAYVGHLHCPRTARLFQARTGALSTRKGDIQNGRNDREGVNLIGEVHSVDVEEVFRIGMHSGSHTADVNPHKLNQLKSL